MSVLPALFRRRQVWLPTIWGALLLLGCAAAAAVVLGLSAYRLLAPEVLARGPAGSGARTLVVEGWLDPPGLQQAVTAFRRGHYERVLTTGGPIDYWGGRGAWDDFASRAAAYLRTRGLADVPVVAVPAPATALDRTYHSALQVREWAQRERVALSSIDLFTAGAHARRTRMVYRLVLGEGVEVGVLNATADDVSIVRWWDSSVGAKSVLGESVSLVWTLCCFWPPPSPPPAAATVP